MTIIMTLATATAIMAYNSFVCVRWMHNEKQAYYLARAGVEALSSYTAQDVLDERSRELMWEGCRRSDLIRFGQFTTADYVWEYKGSVKEGVAVAEHRNLFPLPPADVNANGNLKQNAGY